MSPNEQRLRSLYNKAVQHFSLPDFEKFVQDIQNPDVLEKVREGLSEYYNVPSSEQMMEDLFNIVPGKEDRINSAAADKLPEPDMDLAKTMFEAIDNKDEESGFLPPEEISMVADQVVQPVYNINAIQQDLENPLVAAEIKHEQDRYDKLSPVDQFEFREPETAAKLKPLVEEYRQTLSNINESDEEYKKTLLANFIEEDLSEPTSEGEKLNLETVNLPDAPTPMERLDRLVGTNAVDKLFIDDEKPAWMSDQVYQEVKHYKETGEISDSVIDKASDQLKTQTLNKVKSDKLNAFYHANKDLTQIDRNKLTALLADQVEGGLDFKSVMDLSNNPSLMDLQAKNIQLRSSDISKKMKSIQEQQDELDNNEQFVELNSQAEEIQRQLDVMDKNGISNDSPESIKKEYNDLLTSYNGVIDEYKASGLLDKREKLAEDIIAWNKERDSLLADSNELGDVSLSLELATKNFSSLDKAILSMEQSFLGATASTVGTTLGMVGEVIDKTIGEEDATALSSFLNKVEGVALDYNESLQQEMAVAMAPKPSMSDAWDAGALSGYLSQSFAEGMPSIATVLMTRAGGKMSSPSKKSINKASGAERFKLQAKANVAQARASKIAQGIFFNMSYGLKGSEINIAQRNAPKAIVELEKKLDSGLLSPFEIAETKNQIEELNRVKDLNILQKAGSQLISGSVDMYSERIGTLRYMKNLNRIAAPVGSRAFKKAMYQGLNLGINAGGIELAEETMAQIGNNLSDIYILGENKSILDGINAEFAFNVGLTSLAIQGPTVGSNLYAMLGDNVKTKNDYQFEKANFDRLIEIETALNDGTKRSKKEKKILKAEQDLILERAAFRNIENVEKISALSEPQQIELFDLISQRKEYINNLVELGGRADAGSKAIKKQKEQFTSGYKSVDTQIEKLLNTRKTKATEDQKDAFDPAMAAYNQGLFEFYNNIVGVTQELNNKKYTEITDETTVEELRELYGDRAEQLIEARGKNQNATFIGEDIIVYKDNIGRSIGSTLDRYVALLSAVAPIHELQHIQNRKAGIVKDGVVVESAQLGLEQAEKQLEINKETGKISQEDYNNFLSRKQAYTSSVRELQTQLSNGEITKEQYDDLIKNQGVDVEEVLNLFGDMVAAGVLSKYDFSKISGLKYMLKNLANKFNPKTGFLIPLKTGDDIFNYIKSFQSSVQDFNLQAGPPEDETDGKFSKGPSEEVQRLYDEQGEAAAFDIIEQFKPITNKIVQRRSEAPGFDRQLLTDEIETGERGILDLIRAYDPESGVPLAAYINKFLPSRAIEASKRVLGEEFTDDVTEQVGLAAVEEADDTPVVQPKRAIKLKSRLSGDVEQAVKKVRAEVDNLPIADLDFKSLKNIALQEVQEMFGIKPKPGNLTKDDVRNAQQFINKNAEALITMLPEGSTPGGTSTGVQKVLLDNFYTKTDRVKMSKTGSKAGLSAFEKNKNISPALFKEVFGITPAGEMNLADRNTSARIKALVSQTERMLTNQEVREALQDKGLPVPSKLSEGKAELMFSKGVKMTKAQQRKLDKARKLFTASTGEQLLAEQKNWNQILKANGLDPINMKSFEGREAYRLWLANVLAPLVPKEFFTINSAGTFTGKTLSVKDLDGNKTGERDYAGNFAFLNSKQVAAFLDRIQEDGIKFASKIIPGLKRASYVKLNEKFGTEEFEQQQKDKEKGFKQVLDVLNKLIQDDISNAPFVAAMLSSTSAYQGHMMRTFSPIMFTNYTGLKPVEEHTQPASDLGKFLFNRMLQGNYDLYVDGALNNYFQGLLPYVNDLMLKGVGVNGKSFNYTANAPVEFAYDILMGTKSIWIRYFNPNVNSQVREDENGKIHKGVDPNILIESNGKSVAENFGINVDENQITPSVISKQQDLLYQILNGDISQEVAKQRLDEFLKTAPGLKASKGINVTDLSYSKVLNVSNDMTSEDVLSKAAGVDEALRLANKLDQPIKKIRVFDFDDTLAQSNSLVFWTKPDGTEGELTAEQFAEQGAQLVEQGAVMDFTDFDIVRDGKRGPLFNLAKKIKDARGNEDLFVLTARSPLSQEAIYEFLKSEGLEFKKENIIGLGNSTGEAKANWLVDKAAEGYNDFYFADDALQNVKAVQDAMSVLDVKSRVQQAKLKFSQGLDQEFDQLITMKKDPMFKKEISKEKGRLLGKDKDSFKFFIPYSAEDLVGLIYPTLAKGPLGNLQMSWYKKHLLDPLAKADGDLRADRLQLINDFKKLKKDLNIPKDLNKSTSIGGFTKEQAVRVYLWYKNGITNIPGVNAEDLKEMTEIIESDPQLIEFAEELLKITKGDGWSEPASGWTAGTLSTDIQQLLNTTKRYKYYEDFNQRIDKIYSEANLNKLEAMYGRKYRDALENMIKRIKTGKNRSSEGTRLSNRILDYINGSNAAIMFLNTRSAVLQTISAINYVNWNFNNPLKAGAAFANQPQYWKDFMTLMNSDYLKDRRQGLRINVTESEIADAAKTAKNKAKGAIAYIMEKGYAPTQFADSFAIAAGGATYYRNRINDLMENSGLDEKQATEQALREWKEISEESQQSSRPDKISQQQSSDYGRLILMFANTPMQYARIQKRSIQDLIAGRGDWKTNVSKIAYYGFVQNLIFNSLQNALFAIGAGDGDDDEDDKKVYRTINGMSDSMLRGLGIGGASASVVKNLLLDIYERSKRSRPEYVDATWKLLQFSPPISSKISKIRGAAYQFDSKKRRQEMIDKGFAIDNPAYLAGAKVVSATTNIPLDRALLKYDNFTGAFEEEKEWWESVAMILGWPEWQLKSEKKQSSRSRSSRTKSSRSSSNRNKSKRR